MNSRVVNKKKRSMRVVLFEYKRSTLVRRGFYPRNNNRRVSSCIDLRNCDFLRENTSNKSEKISHKSPN